MPAKEERLQLELYSVARVVYEILLDSFLLKLVQLVSEFSLSGEEQQNLFLKYKVHYFDQRNAEPIRYMLQQIMPHCYPKQIVELISDILLSPAVNLCALPQRVSALDALFPCQKYAIDHF